MLIVGVVNTPAEAREISFIAKHLVVGKRAGVLGKQSME